MGSVPEKVLPSSRSDMRLGTIVRLAGSEPLREAKLKSTRLTTPLVHATRAHVPLQGLPPSCHEVSADALPSSYLTCSSASYTPGGEGGRGGEGEGLGGEGDGGGGEGGSGEGGAGGLGEGGGDGGGGDGGEGEGEGGGGSEGLGGGSGLGEGGSGGGDGGDGEGGGGGRVEEVARARARAVWVAVHMPEGCQAPPLTPCRWGWGHTPADSMTRKRQDNALYHRHGREGQARKMYCISQPGNTRLC